MVDVNDIKKIIDETDDWHKAYWAGQYIYDQDSHENDRLIINAYEKAFSLGLNINSDRDLFLTATQQLVKIYFQFSMYDEAINKFLILDSNSSNLPDWFNIYYASAQIHTENILYWAERPEFFFKRIDYIDETNEESHMRKKCLFLDFLNRISEISTNKKNININTDDILSKAVDLGLEYSNECNRFKYAVGLVDVLPETNEEKNEIEYKKHENDNEEIEILKKQNAQYKEEIERLKIHIKKEENEKAVPPEITNNNLYDVNTFLLRKQKILIIGGSETKENHLRGKLKNLGFDFSKEQLEFELEYDNVKDYASRIKPWEGKYAGIIVGPCPHKAKDINGYSSFIEQIKKEEGYPHVEEAKDKTGTLKITNASIADAMVRMAIYLQSIV